MANDFKEAGRSKKSLWYHGHADLALEPFTVALRCTHQCGAIPRTTGMPLSCHSARAYVRRVLSRDPVQPNITTTGVLLSAPGSVAVKAPSFRSAAQAREEQCSDVSGGGDRGRGGPTRGREGATTSA